MNEGLTDFLYILVRDHLPAGIVRGIIKDHVQAMPGLKRHYSDPHLEAWARSRAEEIAAAERDVTHDQGPLIANR